MACSEAIGPTPNLPLSKIQQTSVLGLRAQIFPAMARHTVATRKVQRALLLKAAVMTVLQPRLLAAAEAEAEAEALAPAVAEALVPAVAEAPSPTVTDVLLNAVLEEVEAAHVVEGQGLGEAEVGLADRLVRDRPGPATARKQEEVGAGWQ